MYEKLSTSMCLLCTMPKLSRLLRNLSANYCWWFCFRGVRFCSLWILYMWRVCRKELLSMKLMNYDTKHLIMQNVRSTTKKVPCTYTSCQYQILCKLIRQKKITKQFFEFLLLHLYDLTDWRQLNYSQMYELIHVLTYFNYRVWVELIQLTWYNIKCRI